jgi:hypothetical protein
LEEEWRNEVPIFNEAVEYHGRVQSLRVGAAHEPKGCAVHELKVVGSSHRHSQITAEHVAQSFKCGLDKAKATLESTTQLGVRTSLHPMNRQSCMDHINFRRRRLKATMLSDTVFPGAKSLTGMEQPRFIIVKVL